MFNFIRKHQRLMQLVLLVLIVPSFVLIGVGGYTTYNSGQEELVIIGGQSITQQEFDAARRNQFNELQRSMGERFDPALIDTPQAKQQLLDTLINRRALIEVATTEYFNVSDMALRQAIASLPEMQEEGVFSAERYNQLLAGAGLSSREFEQLQRAELTLSRVITPVVDTAVLPQDISLELQKILTDSRTIQLYDLSAAEFAAAQTVTEQEIEAWYEANKAQLQLPDYVNADFILLNEAAAVSSVNAVSDDDLHTYYEQNKSRFFTPARAHLSHILIATGASDKEQQAAQQRVKALATQAKSNPADFAQLAQAESEDKGSAASGGELGWVVQGSWPTGLEKAVFSLNKGEVSGVIEGPDGYHIFKVNDYVPEQNQDFETVRDDITEEVRQQLAAEKFAEMATQLTNLVYESPESLAAAADALALPIQQSVGIARDRLLSPAELGIATQPAPEAALLDDPRVRRALYSAQALEQGQNAGLIELASDAILAVRVNEFVPAHTPELAQLQSQVKEQLIYEKSLVAARQAGEELLQALHSGANTDVSFSPSIEVSRINSQQLPNETLETVMSLSLDGKALPAYTGAEIAEGYQLVKIVAQDSASSDPLLSDMLQAQLQQLWGEAQEQAFLEALRVQLQVQEVPAAIEKVMSADLDEL